LPQNGVGGNLDPSGGTLRRGFREPRLSGRHEKGSRSLDKRLGGFSHKYGAFQVAYGALKLFVADGLDSQVI